jgi:hypothetical protein
MPKLCEFETCRKQASYGEFYGKPIRCKEHKKTFYLTCCLCNEGNCKTIPNYNYENKSKGIYCSKHKKDGMIDIKNKKCIYESCKNTPTYNFEGETKRLYCSKHKKEEMVDISHIFCLYKNCKIRANYNYEDKKNGLYCFEHKKDGMIDIKNKKCIYEGCKTTPSFNFEGETRRLYCMEHKKVGMINITNKKCLYESCKKMPAFNKSGEKNGLYCLEHKKDGMINVISPICKSVFCLGTRANPKYKGFCSSCYQNLFPLDSLTFQIRSKTKEIAVRDYINSIFEGFQHDKPLWSGNCDCTHRRRIDHRKLIGNTLLCIETDENQHKGYDEKDEDVRYDDLFMLHGGKFIYIRFNPDKFKDKNGKSVNPMIYTRLPILKEEIEKQIKRIENEENFELLEIVKLYYNE